MTEHVVDYLQSNIIQLSSSLWINAANVETFSFSGNGGTVVFTSGGSLEIGPQDAKALKDHLTGNLKAALERLLETE